jgi:polysaccharide biosynthesis transport protein
MRVFRRTSPSDTLALNALPTGALNGRAQPAARGEVAAPSAAPTRALSGTQAWQTYGYGDLAANFRRICTQVGWSQAPHGRGEALAITSAARAEGKTSLAAAMAISVALDHTCKTLLVECDLLRPSLAETFEVPATPGLADVLSGDAPFADALKPTRLGNLHILPAGTMPDNPSRLLRSNGVAEVLAEARDGFGFVIVDLPSALETSDAAVLAQQADGAILVARAGFSDRHDVQQAMAVLKAASIRGVVLNSWRTAVPGLVTRMLNP